MKRIYQGFRKRSLGVVQFDTAKNRFLAAGDDFSIKIWDMDNTQLLTCIDTDGGLPVSISDNFIIFIWIYIIRKVCALSRNFTCSQMPGKSSNPLQQEWDTARCFCQ